jgi:hypothetical protein
MGLIGESIFTITRRKFKKGGKEVLLFWGKVVGGVCALLLLTVPLALYFVNHSSPAASTQDKLFDQKATARVMACDFVKENLTAPATAKFPWSSDAYLIVETHGRYKVESFVDSQNAFGTPIRKKFVVIMSHDPTDQGWTLEKIDFY